MVERREGGGGAAAGGGGGGGGSGSGCRRSRAAGLGRAGYALQQCGQLQDLIDISLSSLQGLRTKCAASNDLTQQEIRTLEVRRARCPLHPTHPPTPKGAPGLPTQGGFSQTCGDVQRVV
ncbi:kinase suppressor of Ras 1 [Crotalus adamanteus]|uniref:Kinase suppressor of Ras 1 n=1 Tax=Crotalus adamanteus TaxID=8729 RepID=A0AAW1CDQ2_CROAD